MRVLTPPTHLPDDIRHYSVFLAGSIEMGVAEKWQDKVVKNLDDLDIIILNPRRDSWDNSWEQSIENENFYNQVTWELEGLDQCHMILMYFDPSTKSPISLLELGLYAESAKLMVCCPDGFWRKGNVEIVCEKYGIPLYNDFEDFIFDARENIIDYLED